MNQRVFEVVHTGFPTFPWQAVIDGWYLRSTHGQIRKFATDTAAIRALRKEAAQRGLDYAVPYTRFENNHAIL